MNSMLKQMLFVLASLSISATSMADDISLGEPSFGGNGCPQGSTAASLSPDGKFLSILFDDYIAEAGGNERRRVRKNCNISIPVHIPQGLSVSIIAIDYRGYVYTPPGGSARFSAEYFLAGQRGPRFSKRFGGNYDDEYFFENDLTASAIVWSACGADVNLRANTRLMAMSNRRMDEAMATVDSADVEAGIVYHLQWRSCN